MAIPNLATLGRQDKESIKEAQLPKPDETDIQHWPPSATLTPWFIPIGRNHTIPWRQPGGHIGKLIGADETVVLITFRDTTDWEGIGLRMIEAQDLDVTTMIMTGLETPNSLGALIYGAGDYAAKHGREEHKGEKVAFVASDHILRILGISMLGATRNSLTLIQNGRIRTRWVAEDLRGTRAHDWSGIKKILAQENQDLTLVPDDPDDEITEVLD